MRLALKVDVDTLRGTRARRADPGRAAEEARRGGRRSCSRSAPTTRAARSSACSGPGSCARSSARRWSGTTACGRCCTARCCPARHRPARRRRMRAVRDDGFEIGVHTWDHIRWQDGVAGADAAWTRAEMHRACERYTEIFGSRPRVHGAAGWQMNVARAAPDAARSASSTAPTAAARIRTCRYGTPSSSAARSCRRRCRRSTS